ncbi:hypothetical protein CK204_27580, partial [Klebsiella pneumoniae]
MAISVKAYHVRTGEQHSDLPDGSATLRHRPHGVLAVAISVKAYHVRTGEQHSDLPDGSATLRHRPHGV